MFSNSRAWFSQRSLRTLIVLACLSGISFAQETGNCKAHDPSSRPDCPGAIAFFHKLQAAVHAGDKIQLASMVSYPMRAAENGKRFQVRTPQEFLNDYSQLLNPAVICAIESAKDSDVWGNYQGFMIGSGAVWWDAVIPSSVRNPQPDSGNYPFKIIAINGEDVVAPGCAGTK